jgi:hypothetical protein
MHVTKHLVVPGEPLVTIGLVILFFLFLALA